MVTMIILLLLFSLINADDINDEDGRALERKYDKKMLIGILFGMEVMALCAIHSNINEAPKLLNEERERLVQIEEEINVLTSDFNYVAESGDSVDKVYEFEEQYRELKNEIAFLKSDIDRNERRINPDSFGNRFSRFMLDFGIFSSKFY